MGGEPSRYVPVAVYCIQAGYFFCYALGLYLITLGILMQIDAELPDEDEITFLDVEQKTGSIHPS